MRLNEIELGVRDPNLLWGFLEDTLYRLRKLVKQGKLFKAADFLYNTATGGSFYIPYQFAKSGSHLVEIDLFGNRMLVNLSDRGISYELLIHGDHEEKCTYAFRDEIKYISQDVESPTCIEVGANIGYYALQEADLLGGSGKVIAFEPVPDSIHLLRKNIIINNYDKRFVTHQCAIGNKRDTVEMEIGEKSNLARVSYNKDVHDNVPMNRIETDMISIDEYINESDCLTGNSINIVRMDVETYEVNVLKGMSQVLEGDQPLVLFIELHAKHLKETGQMEDFIELVSDKGFSVTLVTRRRKKFNINTIRGLEDLNAAANVILSRR